MSLLIYSFHHIFFLFFFFSSIFFQTFFLLLFYIYKYIFLVFLVSVKGRNEERHLPTFCPLFGIWKCEKGGTAPFCGQTMDALRRSAVSRFHLVAVEDPSRILRGSFRDRSRIADIFGACLWELRRTVTTGFRSFPLQEFRKILKDP